jgi:AraC-like DNA-binding protein
LGELDVSTDLQRSGVLTGYAQVARLVGLEPKGMLLASHLPIASLADPELKVSFQAIALLLETSAQNGGMLYFGLRMVETRRLTHMGMVALLSREQPTARAALQTIIDNLWMMNEALTLTLEEHGGQGVLALHWRRPAYVRRQIVELTVGVLVHALRVLIGPSWRPQAVLLPHPAPPDLTIHRRVLRVVPTFRFEIGAIVLLSRDLDTPVAGADPEAARILQRHLAQVSRPLPLDTVEQVRDLAARSLASGGCSTDQIAAQLGIDARALHRRLAGHGVTFSGVVDELRGELAEQHLREGGHTLTEISELLGYASLSAFSRWYSQRYGVAPSRRLAERDGLPPQARERSPVVISAKVD